MKARHELRWKGYVLRIDHAAAALCMMALQWVPDERSRWGRPWTTWKRTVEKEMSAVRSIPSWVQARIIAQDRRRWKRCIEALCADRHEEERWRQRWFLHIKHWARHTMAFCESQQKQFAIRVNEVSDTQSLPLRFNGHFSMWTWFSQCRNVSILDLLELRMT